LVAAEAEPLLLLWCSGASDTPTAAVPITKVIAISHEVCLWLNKRRAELARFCFYRALAFLLT